MIYNVSQLMKAAPGTTLDVDLDDSDDLNLQEGEAELAGPVTGHVRLHRTNQGIFADGTVTTAVTLNCDRCLSDFVTPLTFPVREEFYPTIDVTTGAPLQTAHGEDAFPIDSRHELDLREAIRQNLVLALSARALCREDCEGLCQQCGQNLNEGDCDCPPEPTDERFGVLRALLVDATPDAGSGAN
ncbi:MAG: DUF177 domain-containing protein [Ktedonobacterales bacterium]